MFMLTFYLVSCLIQKVQKLCLGVFMAENELIRQKYCDGRKILCQVNHKKTPPKQGKHEQLESVS